LYYILDFAQVSNLATVAESAAISKLTYTAEEAKPKKKQDIVEITEVLFLFSMKCEFLSIA